MDGILNLLDPEYLIRMAVDFAPKLLAALVILFLFWILVRVTAPTLRMILKRARFADTLIRLLVDNVYRVTVLGIGLVMAVSQLGINVAAALAGIGVMGIAVGFAAQDSLANTIAGFLIFWDKPFGVGDIIETQDRYGAVQTITMRTTRIRTLDNTFVVIPNRKIIEDVLINHSMYGEARVQVPVGIAYKEDIPAARRVILAALGEVDGIASTPEPTVVVSELAGSGVNLSVRVWVTDANSEQPVFFRTLEACKLALDEAGIEIPYPHLQLFVDDVRPRVWAGAARLAGTARAANGGTPGERGANEA